MLAERAVLAEAQVVAPGVDDILVGRKQPESAGSFADGLNGIDGEEG